MSKGISTETPGYSDIVSIYRFEGNYLDDLGSNNLSAYNSSSPSSTTGYDGGGGLQFSNSALFASTPTDVKVNNFSIQAWVYLSTAVLAADGVLVDFYSSLSGFRLGFYTTVPNTIALVGGNVSNTIVLSDALFSNLPVASWFHLLVTYSVTASNSKIYVNGTDKTRVSNFQSNTKPNMDLYLGSTANHAYYLNAKVDDVIIWKRYLTESEALTLYNQQKP